MNTNTTHFYTLWLLVWTLCKLVRQFIYMYIEWQWMRNTTNTVDFLPSYFNNPPRQISLLTKYFLLLHRMKISMCSNVQAVTLTCINGFSNELFWIYNVFYFIFFSLKLYNKRVIDIVIRSKNRDLLSLRTDQTRALHSFDPDHDSSEPGFLDLITVSVTFLYCNPLIYISK